jgi:hypothetical protein
MTRNPNLVGVPAAIAGDPKKRTGIILAANYEARYFGVKTAMVVREALKLCPNIKLVPPDHHFYAHKSDKLMNLLLNYTPLIEKGSIDEAWLDMTGSEGIYGEPLEAAQKLMNSIQNELNLPCSIGISENKFLSKMAADIKEKLDSIIEDDAEQKAIHIIIADEKTTVHKEPEYFNSWFDKVVFNNSYHYSLINDELLLSMGAQVAPAGFIGEIEVIYEYKNGVLAAGALSFKQEDEHEKAISELIRDFGSKLKHVSLLAPEDTVKASMQENYSDYVSPALLAQWENDLQNVPGRVTSSPWPERIEIVDMDKLSDYRYRIEADIIEMTSVEMVNGGEAARRSISLEVEKTGTRWFIVRYQNNENPVYKPVYKNSEYGFSFALPGTWRDYSIISSQWEGMDPESGVIGAKGPIISIRHPQWTEKNPRQDIPIMVFTQSQWKKIQQRELSVGAAPIPPKELGRNDSYVFALPARYNYAFPTGYEEVERILDSNPLTAI